MTRRRQRRAGDHWRLLVHDMALRGSSGVAHHIAHDKRYGGDGSDSEWSRYTEIPGTDFDELVVGGGKAVWLHIEQKDTGTWWLDIGGVVLWIRADRDGNPVSVAVYGPGSYAEPRLDCAYEVTWPDT